MRLYETILSRGDERKKCVVEETATSYTKLNTKPRSDPHRPGPMYVFIVAIRLASYHSVISRDKRLYLEPNPLQATAC